MDSLYNLPAERIDLKTVVNFLESIAVETATVEMKRQWTPKLTESVAAFANTYGGIVLVGVDERRPSAEGIVGIPVGEELRVISACHDSLQPPYVPEIVLVPLPAGDRHVLLLRVDAERAPRPIVRQGTVHVRVGNRNARADRYRMEQLFSESALPETSQMLGSWHPQFFRSEPYQMTGPDLVFQVSALLPLTSLQRVGLVIGSDARSRLRAALEGSRLGEWLNAIMVRWRVPNLVPWRQHGHNTSSHANCTASALLENGGIGLEVEGILELRPRALAMSVATVLLNRTVENAARSREGQADLERDEELKWARLKLEDIYYLLSASIATLWGPLAEVSAEMISPHLWRPVGPGAQVSGHTERALLSWFDLDLPEGSPTNRTSGDEFQPLPDLVVSDAEDRNRLVRAWLRRLLLNMGIADADQHVDAI